MARRDTADGKRTAATLRRSGAGVVVAMAVLAAACTSTTSQSTPSQPDVQSVVTEAMTVPAVSTTVAGDSLDVEVLPGETINISIPGVVDISGPAGSISGRVQVTPVTFAVPDGLGDLTVQATGGVKVGLVSEPSQPLSLSFTVPELPAGSDIAAVHVADDGSLEPLPATMSGNHLVVEAATFSIIGWISWSSVWDFLSGTTPANSCSPAPSWATMIAHPESVHACVSTNTDGSGRVRAELDIKSNRGTWQEVTLPSQSVDYLWAEGQPSQVMDLYRWVLGEGGGYVLLPPGARITMGFLQPSSYQAPAVTLSPADEWLWLLSTGSAILDAVGWKDLNVKVVSSVVTTAKCMGAGVFPLSAPHSPLSSGFDRIGLVHCLVDELKGLASDPQKWVDHLPDSLRRRISQTDFVATTSAAKKIGNAALVLSLISFSFTLFNEISDQVIGAFGSLAASQVTIGLDPPRPTTTPAPAPTQAPVPVTPAPTPAPPATPTPTQAPSAGPTIASFQVGVTGTSVTMAGQIGWAAGADPVTCTFNVDGAVLYSSGCGVSPSVTRTLLAGTHTFQLVVCDRFSQCATSDTLSRAVGQTAPPPVPATTYTEYTGGVANTWSNYTNAGGTGGAQIAAFTSVQISCRLQGFAVADGNTWWYRIASSPWNNQFYVSADIFYNTPGMTSGSLHGTPFYDPAVPLC